MLAVLSLSPQVIIPLSVSALPACSLVADRLKPKKIVGLDFSSENIAKAQQAFGGNRIMEFRQGAFCFPVHVPLWFCL